MLNASPRASFCAARRARPGGEIAFGGRHKARFEAWPAASARLVSRFMCLRGAVLRCFLSVGVRSVPYGIVKGLRNKTIEIRVACVVSRLGIGGLARGLISMRARFGQ